MKKAELILTQAWQQQATWLTALRPLSKMYGWVTDFQKSQYKNGNKTPYKAPVPVLVIGNITVGGSGKTPLIITLVRYLQEKNIAVGVISRGYGGNAVNMPSLVEADSSPTEVGDEPCLIVGETAVPMAVSPNRKQAIELLLEHYPNLQLIISDDGLQHHKLYRDDEWIVVDVKRGFGNQKLFPEGFLREPVDRLIGATVVYHIASEFCTKQDKFEYTCFLKMGQLEHLLDKDKKWHVTAKKVYALTGIGYPARFFDSLRGLGFEVIERPRPDHYEFTFDDIKGLQDYPIVVTTKDAVKIKMLINADNQACFENVWVLPVEMQVSDSVFGLMDDFLKKCVFLSH